MMIRIKNQISKVSKLLIQSRKYWLLFIHNNRYNLKNSNLKNFSLIVCLRVLGLFSLILLAAELAGPVCHAEV